MNPDTLIALLVLELGENPFLLFQVTKFMMCNLLQQTQNTSTLEFGIYFCGSR